MDEYLVNRLAQGDAAGPTYVYLFAHRGAASFTEIFLGGSDSDYGTGHTHARTHMHGYRNNYWNIDSDTLLLCFLQACATPTICSICFPSAVVSFRRPRRRCRTRKSAKL